MLQGRQSELDLYEAKSICDQVLDGLQQLEKSIKCHNDLKPENVLYNIDLDTEEYEIKFCDFGTEGRTGGTPGWTWPKFMSPRQPGKSDVYSARLLILYLMCESEEVFYSIRNNYVENGQLWLPVFRKIPLIKLVIKMINLELSVQESRDQWEQISDSVQKISKEYLMSIGVPASCLKLQGEDNSDEVNQMIYVIEK